MESQSKSRSCDSERSTELHSALFIQSLVTDSQIPAYASPPHVVSDQGLYRDQSPRAESSSLRISTICRLSCGSFAARALTAHFAYSRQFVQRVVTCSDFSPSANPPHEYRDQGSCKRLPRVRVQLAPPRGIWRNPPQPFGEFAAESSQNSSPTIRKYRSHTQLLA